MKDLVSKVTVFQFHYWSDLYTLGSRRVVTDPSFNSTIGLIYTLGQGGKNGKQNRFNSTIGLIYTAPKKSGGVGRKLFQFHYWSDLYNLRFIMTFPMFRFNSTIGLIYTISVSDIIYI